MSVEDLLAGNYNPFLTMSYREAFAYMKVCSKVFSSPTRQKSLAVSACGSILRRKVRDRGYQDSVYLNEEGQLVLRYISGDAEETRRQKQKIRGDAILFECGTGPPADLHAVFHGHFVRVDETDIQPKTHVIITSFVRAGPDGTLMKVPFERVKASSLTDDRKRMRTLADRREHLFVDTESGSPRGTMERVFPVLQVAYVHTTHDTQEVLSSRMEHVKYPDHLLGETYNHELCDVNKFDMTTLARGMPALALLGDFRDLLRRVSASGGIVFAHNAKHDIRQIEKTASLLGFSFEGLSVRVVDTVRAASCLVPALPAGQSRALGEIASHYGIQAPSGQFHLAQDDAHVLWRIVRDHLPLPSIESMVEQYVLQ